MRELPPLILSEPCVHEAHFRVDSELSPKRLKVNPVSPYLTRNTEVKFLNDFILNRASFNVNQTSTLVKFFTNLYHITNSSFFLPLTDKKLVKFLLEGRINLQELSYIYSLIDPHEFFSKTSQSLITSPIEILYHLYQQGLYTFHLVMPKPKMGWPPLPKAYYPKDETGLIEFEKLIPETKSYFYDLISRSYEIPSDVIVYNPRFTKSISKDDILVNRILERKRIWNVPKNLQGLAHKGSLPQGTNIIRSWHDVLRFLPQTAINLIFIDFKRSSLSLSSYLKKMRQESSEEVFDEVRLWWLAGYYQINLLNVPHKLHPKLDKSASVFKTRTHRVINENSPKALFRPSLGKGQVRRISFLKSVIALHKKKLNWEMYSSLHRLAKIALADIVTQGDERTLFYSDKIIYNCLTQVDFKAPFTLKEAICKYNRYRFLPPDVQYLLLTLYKDYSLMIISNLSDDDRSILDKLIVEKGISEQIAQNVGMYIPSNIKVPETKNNYIISNLISYQRVIKRQLGLIPPSLNRPETLVPEYLAQFSDLELMKYLGIFVSYNSRCQLLEKIQGLLINPGFFRPQNYSGMINNETTLKSDTFDPNLFLVAYGTLSEYRCYELDELNLAFILEKFEEGYQLDLLEISHNLDNTTQDLDNDLLRYTTKIPLIIPHLRRPENPKIDFSSEEVLELKNLLSSLLQDLNEEQNRIVEEIIFKITTALDLKGKLDLYQNDLKDNFSSLHPSQQEKVINWLKSVFETGMYMRGWSGPGTPYPLLEKDTYETSLDERTSASDTSLDERTSVSEASLDENTLKWGPHIERTIRNIKPIYKELKSLPHQLANNFMAHNLYHGQLRRMNKTLLQILEIVVDEGYKFEEACIRMNSTILIGTAYYYLKILTREKLLNFDPFILDPIM